jgi:hypothetical protein
MVFPLLEVGTPSKRLTADVPDPHVARRTYRQNRRPGSRIARNGD